MSLDIDKLKSNVQKYQNILEARNRHVKSVSRLNITGCRGQFASNLILFAMDGEWSVVSQNHIYKNKQYKLPFVCIREVLEMMVETRERVQENLHDVDKVREYIEAFQLFFVLKQEEYMDKNVDKYDYMAAWSNVTSWAQLAKNPLKNYDKWHFFFTVKDKPSINKLMVDIVNVLEEHNNFLKINEMQTNTTNTKPCDKKEDIPTDAKNNKRKRSSFEDMVETYRKVRSKQ